MANVGEKNWYYVNCHLHTCSETGVVSMVCETQKQYIKCTRPFPPHVMTWLLRVVFYCCQRRQTLTQNMLGLHLLIGITHTHIASGMHVNTTTYTSWHKALPFLNNITRSLKS